MCRSTDELGMEKCALDTSLSPAVGVAAMFFPDWPLPRVWRGGVGR